jgi:hypothetical protein
MQIFFSFFLPAAATVSRHRYHCLHHAVIHVSQTTAMLGVPSLSFPFFFLFFAVSVH